MLVAFGSENVRSAKLKRVREEFFSASFGERDPETAAVAVPVFNGSGLAGALAISGPRYRFEQADIQRIVAKDVAICCEADGGFRRLFRRISGGHDAGAKRTKHARLTYQGYETLEEVYAATAEPRGRLP